MIRQVTCDPTAGWTGVTDNRSRWEQRMRSQLRSAWRGAGTAGNTPAQEANHSQRDSSPSPLTRISESRSDPNVKVKVNLIRTSGLFVYDGIGTGLNWVNSGEANRKRARLRPRGR